MKNLKLALVATLAIALAGCQPSDPDLAAPKAPTPAAPPEKPFQNFDKHYSFARSESSVQQAKYDENTITASFKMSKADGSSVNKLKASDIKVTENGVSVNPFSFSASEKKFEKTAEIVFLVDVTFSMAKLIETAKQRLKEFIRTTKDREYHVRMCVSGFGDYTTKFCTRFFDNREPKQVEEFNTELAALAAAKTAATDPGAPDLDENPMRALIDASNAPWSQDSLRFVILVTDWGFLYLPNNPGDKGNPGEDPRFAARNKVPQMREVTKAIKDSQIKVFAITRTEHVHQGKKLVWDGYNTPFQGEPGIVQASCTETGGVQSNCGEHFNFDKVLNKQITLDSILERILNRMESTYQITYSVDKANLDPTLPADKRNVQVTSPLGKTTMVSTVSSMPEGRPQYKQTWKVADNAIDADSLHVWVDGRELSRTDVTVSGGEVKFAQVPKAGAQIKLAFFYRDISKNFRIEPMTFRGVLNEKTTKVFLNGKEAKAEDLSINPNLDGNSTLTVAPSALDESDPYDIRKSQGLTIRVITK